MSSTVIDSEMTRAEALAQNPKSLAPESLLPLLVCETVLYWGFDGRLHQGQIVVHHKCVADVIAFFALAKALRFPIAKVVPISHPRYAWSDELSCSDNNSSGYNYREIAGEPGKLSKHALGIAIDINPMHNPCIEFDPDGREISRTPVRGFYHTELQGTLTAHHPLVVHMKSLNWDWGGNWRKYGLLDYHHIEFDGPI